MKHAFLIGLGLISLCTPELKAGVLGKYTVSGSGTYYGSRYGLWGTATVTSRATCTLKLDFSDGDRATIRGKFKTPLKETKKKQTVQCTWNGEGETGTGTMTVSGSSSAYSLKFTIKGGGLKGSGSGTKRP